MTRCATITAARRFARLRLPCLWLAISAVLGIAATSPAASPINPRDIVTVHSRSDQFVVTAPAPGIVSYRPTRRDFKYDPNALHLQPAALVVTCERIKNAVLNELGMTDRWTGRIYLSLQPAAAVSAQIAIVPTRYADGWQFRMEVPDQIDPQFLVRRLVEVTLLEIANRNAPARSAEIPLWLIEGLSSHLMAADADSLVLQTLKLDNVTSTTFPSRRLIDPLAPARQRLSQQNTFSFADLCLPSQEQISGQNWENFRSTSQVLITELLKSPNGPANMQQYVALLPKYLNHQLAFMEAFQGRFRSMLEVEKWWSVTLVNFTGRDQHLKWSPSVCLQRLDEILIAPVEIRSSINTNIPPTRAELKLQNMFEKLNYARQKLAIQNIANQLQQLQWSAPPDMFKLVKDYHTTLLTYLQKREAAVGPGADVKGQASSIRLIVRETAKQLDRLDVIRDDFRTFDATTAKK